MTKSDHDAIHTKIMYYGLERFEVLSNKEKHELTRRFAEEILTERKGETK